MFNIKASSDSHVGDKKRSPIIVDNKKKKWKKTTYTPEQIKELVEGYIIVPPDKWDDIPIGSHIRYIKNDGVFVRGGFVTSHWLNKENKQFIHLANSFKKKNQGYATWPVAHESVSKIYKKVDRDSNIEMDVVRTKTSEIINEINKLVSVIKAQKKRIDKQDADIQHLYSILKKNRLIS